MARTWVASIVAVFSVLLSFLSGPVLFARTMGIPSSQSRIKPAHSSSQTQKVVTSQPKKAPPLLMQGDKSRAVATLQSELITLGYIPRSIGSEKSGAAGAGQGTKASSAKGKTPAIYRQLSAMYHTGVYDTLTKGAVMTFEEANHLAVDGIAGPEVAHALRMDLKAHRKNPFGYTYVEVSQKSPETITIWHNGKVVLTSLCNTGVASAKTAIGTWPVYLRYLSQTMSGVTPWGTKYSDPGIPYVNYFNGGDAIHGFIRKSYGYPQSLGCVELPISEAKKAWQWLHYGTLVTVLSPSSSS